LRKLLFPARSNIVLEGGNGLNMILAKSLHGFALVWPCFWVVWVQFWNGLAMVLHGLNMVWAQALCCFAWFWCGFTFVLHGFARLGYVFGEIWMQFVVCVLDL
jgi:hypothetical protein